ncbi:MAG: SDR family NAD(P)-dependent oxidoreductase [Burkholderiaceae bacterium]
MLHAAPLSPTVASGPARRLAVFTAATADANRDLAELCARHDHDLLLAAASRGEPDGAASAALRGHGVEVELLHAPLSSTAGVDALLAAIGQRPVDILVADTGSGLGPAFLQADFAEIRHAVDTTLLGTLDLIHRIGRRMRERCSGKILITGSFNAASPCGDLEAAYIGSRAFFDGFVRLLDHELKDCGVTVSVLMPGVAPPGLHGAAFGARAAALGAEPRGAPRADPRASWGARLWRQWGVH